MITRGRAPEIIDKLLTQYENVDCVHFAGEYLRLFAQYAPLLVRSWCSIRNFKRLLKIILNTDFNIQGDAVETAMVSRAAG